MTLAPLLPAPHSTANMLRATMRRAIMRTLAGGRERRQYEIAEALQLTKHNNWSTHAVLNAMIDDGTLTFERRHVITVKGGISKQAYRFFRLAHQPRPMTVGDVARDWMTALGFARR